MQKNGNRKDDHDDHDDDNDNDNDHLISLFVQNRLKPFVDNNRVPNILFHGDFDAPKTKIVNAFLNLIYKDESASKMVMTVDCAIEKGDDFIREEIKFFAKTQLSSNTFKTVLLLNADFLSLDSQAALRRCIELFCQNTRFFLVMEKKNNLMAPMLSRFCEIFISSPPAPPSSSSSSSSSSSLHMSKLKTCLHATFANSPPPSVQTLLILAERLYNEAYALQDMMELFQEPTFEFQIGIEKICNLAQLQAAVRNEEALLFYALFAIFETVEKEDDIMSSKR